MSGASSTASSSSSPSAANSGGMGLQGSSGGMGGVPPLDNIRRYRTAFTREQVTITDYFYLAISGLFFFILVLSIKLTVNTNC